MVRTLAALSLRFLKPAAPPRPPPKSAKPPPEPWRSSSPHNSNGMTAGPARPAITNICPRSHSNPRGNTASRSTRKPPAPMPKWHSGASPASTPRFMLAALSTSPWPIPTACGQPKPQGSQPISPSRPTSDSWPLANTQMVIGPAWISAPRNPTARSPPPR